MEAKNQTPTKVELEESRFHEIQRIVALQDVNLKQHFSSLQINTKLLADSTLRNKLKATEDMQRRMEERWNRKSTLKRANSTFRLRTKSSSQRSKLPCGLKKGEELLKPRRLSGCLRHFVITVSNELSSTPRPSQSILRR